VPEWLNMLSYTQSNLKSTDVVVAWWDYGYWLSILGNVTTVADNATVNSTQIENLGFAFMAPEKDSLAMLSKYDQSRVKYILIFEVLQIQESSSSSGTSSASLLASPAGLGDEGKWMWMARISGQAKDRLVSTGHMNPNNAWTDEYAFGNVSSSNQWVWNDQGLDSTIYKLLSYTAQQYCDNTGGLVQSTQTSVTPAYFKTEFIAGLDQSPYQYGIVPLVALYKIDWAAYNNATSTTP
jgi:asparagine N-glycosylation enzyme membrane subunit Stt3